ncbi:MAG: sulfotransferase, partial [Chloroflexota bacterium]
MAPSGRQLRWQAQRLFRPARRALLRHLFRDDNRRLADSILVAGAARSGTTWLGDVLAGENGRILFEPFHPHKIAALRSLSYFPYLRPDEPNEQLAAYARQVFSGAVRHPWIDREIGQLRPTFRVIKEIRANLCLKWFQVHFPEVPQLLIMRHPCAVALSRRQLGWATDSDILAFLEQRPLLNDHLAPHRDTINRAHTDLEKHAVIWCVSHLIPLRQFAPGELTIIFYEDLCLHPERELARIERVVGRP